MNAPRFFLGVISPRIVKFKGEKNPFVAPYSDLIINNSIKSFANELKKAKMNMRITIM